MVYGSVAANDKEIAILTRSMIEILSDLASYIDVPATDVEQKRTILPCAGARKRCSRSAAYTDSQLAAKT